MHSPDKTSGPSSLSFAELEQHTRAASSVTPLRSIAMLLVATAPPLGLRIPTMSRPVAVRNAFGSQGVLRSGDTITLSVGTSRGAIKLSESFWSPPFSIRGSAFGKRAGSLKMLADETPWFIPDDASGTTPKVRWLPPIDPKTEDTDPSSESSLVMPIFPVKASYLPYSNNVLNIYEPRYRKMYNDIIFSGARRFAMVRVDPETGRFAEIGVVFYLDDLKEVSEQTGDQLKYIGTHSVISRVQIKKVLNPKDGTSRETYLRAEVEEFNDVDETPLAAYTATKAEEEVESKLRKIIELQTKLRENPNLIMFIKAFPSTRLGPGTNSKTPGLWGTISGWQEFLKQRLAKLIENSNNDIDKQIDSYIQTNGMEGIKVNQKMAIDDLPPLLRKKIRGTQDRYLGEVEAMGGDPYNINFQILLQTYSYAERLEIFSGILDLEVKRLEARTALQAILSDKDSQ